MKTKLVYCLVSNNNDIYWEEALLSMYSAKRYNSDTCIELIVDDKTSNTLCGSRKKLLNYVDQLHVINLPADYSNKIRSRLLKTSMREIIQGTYLFIDTDTIIAGNLSEIDDFQVELAAVPDSHIDKDHTKLYQNFLSISTAMNELNCGKKDVFFNSGVIFAQDSEKVHIFYQYWKRNYLQLFKQKRITQDQNSLVLTNRQLNYLMKEFPDIYNCQIKRGYVQNTKILHYFNIKFSDKETGGINSFLSEALQDIKKKQDVPEYVRSFIENPFQKIPVLAYIPLLDWYDSPVFLKLYGWKVADNPIMGMQFTVIEGIVKVIDKINMRVHQMKIYLGLKE